MASVASDIADFLQTQGHGTLAGDSEWAIYVGKEPEKPNSCITVYDTPGDPDNPDGPFYSPRIQIRIRCVSYADGYAKGEQIRDELIIETDRIINDRYFSGVWLDSDLAKIGTDDNDREIFTINFRIMCEAYSTA